jgi:hypothetical protein
MMTANTNTNTSTNTQADRAHQAPAERKRPRTAPADAPADADDDDTAFRARIRKLRALQHAAAAEVAVHARALQHHANALIDIHARLAHDAALIDGDDYADRHSLGFEPLVALEYDPYDLTKPAREVYGDTRLDDVADLADFMARDAARIARKTTPPPLWSE